MRTVYQPGICKAPDIVDLSNDSQLYGKNVYFIEPYQPGLSISAILGENVDANLQIGDWDGNIIEIDDLTESHMKALSLNELFIPIASTSGINKYQIFFDSNLAVVDFIGPNGQFISPGMLINLFQNSLTIQNVIDKVTLNSTIIKEMLDEHKELIIKPSIRIVVDNKTKLSYARIHKSMVSHS